MLVRRLFAGLVVVLFGLTVSQSVGQEKDKDKDKDKKDPPVTLAWKFAAGKAFFQKMTTTTKQTMKVMNNDVNQVQDQTFYFAWNTTKVEGDVTTLEQKITGVQMNIDIGGSKISFDSTKDNPANNPLGEFFKALVDTKFTVTLNTKDLKVTGVDGRKAFVDKLANANPQMKPLLEVILSDEALKQMAEPTFAVVPTKAVSAKDTWSRKTSLNMGPIGQYDNEFTYTLLKGDKDGATIQVDTKLNYKAPSGNEGQGGLPFKIKGADLKTKNATGLITFNNKAGYPSRIVQKLTLDGKLTIEIGGQTTTVTLGQDQESVVETAETDFLKAAAPKK